VQQAIPVAAPQGVVPQVTAVMNQPRPSQSVGNIALEGDFLPVSAARNGFTPAQASDFLARFTPQESLKAGDVSLFALLNFPEIVPTATIKRSGRLTELKRVPNPEIGKIRGNTELGELSLDAYLTHARSRAQGMVVIHRGQVVYEQYPGMREQDNHVWMSCSGTLSSHVIAMLEEEGKIDVQKPIDFYVPEFKDTAWSGTKLIDLLDMTTGMEVEETDDARLDPNSATTRMNFAASGIPYNGRVERMIDVLRSAKRLKPAGESFEYSSLVSLTLPVLAEAVERRRWSDIFQSRVWSKMTVEGDMQMGVAPDGLALSQSYAITRLRDMARYGMLYTPSWSKVAHERLVSAAFLKKIQKGGRSDLFLGGATGKRMAGSFAGDVPVSNSYQWDAIFADGDMFKAGSLGQGLYVSPGKDLVIAWFSTAQRTDLTHYARTIAKLVAGDV
jgi:CubicO group peptidase (beta-lactamase class C family)